jgi:hypothetical protein
MPAIRVVARRIREAAKRRSTGVAPSYGLPRFVAGIALGIGLHLLTQSQWSAAAGMLVMAAALMGIFVWARRSYAKHGPDNWRYSWPAFFRLFRRR